MDVRPPGIELRIAPVNGNRSDDPPHSTCPQYEIPGWGHNDSKATHLTDHLGFEEDRKIPVLGIGTVIQRGNITKQAGSRARLDRHCRCIKLFKLSFLPCRRNGCKSVSFATDLPWIGTSRHRFVIVRLPGNHRAAMAFGSRYGHVPAGPQRLF